MRYRIVPYLPWFYPVSVLMEEKMSGESALLIWSGRPAWSEFVFLWFFACIAAIRAAMAFWVADGGSTVIYSLGSGLFITLAVFLRQGMSYRITREGVYTTMGILNRSEWRIPLREISQLHVEQGPLDRLFGIGTLILHLKKEERRERMKGIKDPEVIYQKMRALL